MWIPEIGLIFSCCIEAFLNSVVEGHLSYVENMNPDYNTMSVFTSIQIAIKGYVERFVTVTPEIGLNSSYQPLPALYQHYD